MKYPSDLMLYQQVIHDTRPDWIIETGTAYGGSALFFGDMLQIYGGAGKVISIDISPVGTPEHSKVEYWRESSVDRRTVTKARGRIFDGSGRVMVVLDSDHSFIQVDRELRLWSPLVTIGQYLVVEDCYFFRGEDLKRRGAGQATDRFLTVAKNFQREPLEDQYVFCVTVGGWLKKNG